SLPAGDQSIVGRALAKNPEHRFPACRDFVQALKTAPSYGSMPADKSGPEIRQEATPSPPLQSETPRDDGSETGKLPERPKPAVDAKPAEPAESKDARWIRVQTEAQR